MEDLKTADPALAMEWSAKNLPMQPSMVTAGSNKKVWWKGRCGHEWQATVKNRINGAGCPFCSGNRILKGFNDLATLKPELAVEWSDRNLPLKPDLVLACSNRKAWWKCAPHGHEWEAKIADRYYGSGCPYCSGHLLYRGFNDLAGMYPELELEWSDKNRPKSPEEVFPKSRENVWWKCRVCGHEWKAVVDSRVRGAGCPVCDGRKVKVGINDLTVTDPGVLDEWDYVRNRPAEPTMFLRTSCQMVWWMGSCGHRWRMKIMERTLYGAPCPTCRKEFNLAFPDLLIQSSLRNAGYTVIPDEETIIGVPLANYIRERNAVIEFSRKSYNTKEGYRWECAKTAACRKAKIKLVRILRKNDREFEGCVNIRRMDNSDESLDEALSSAFRILRIKTSEDTGIGEKRETLFREFSEKKAEAVKALGIR